MVSLVTLREETSHAQAIDRVGLGLALAIGASFVLVERRSGGSASAQAPAAQSKTDPKINEAFKKPDVKAYIKRFESDDREVYARRHEIVAALGLKTGNGCGRHRCRHRIVHAADG